MAATILAGGGHADVLEADLAAPDGPHQLAAEVLRIVGGRLDILVANAGISKAASIEDHTAAEFDRLFVVNVRAPSSSCSSSSPCCCRP